MKNTARKSVNWFSPHDILTYNKTFNFVVGVRSAGKTFNSLCYGIRRFLKTGDMFIYCKRQKEELEETQRKLFDEIILENIFPDHELKSSKGGLYIDDKLMGYCIPLSTSLKRRSISYSKVKLIIYDEFMADGITTRYIGRGDAEVQLFEAFYDTVDRMRDECRVIFLSNSFSVANIYFSRYGVKLPDEYKPGIYTFGDIAVQLWSDASVLEARKQTALYRITAGTEYARHAYDNQFIMDKPEFLKQRPGSLQLTFVLIYQGKYFGVYPDWETGIYYVERKKPGSFAPERSIALSNADNSPNNVNIRRVKSLPYIRHFRAAFDENAIFYDTHETFKTLSDVLYLMRVTT